MTTLTIPPDQDSYSGTPGAGAISTQLDGGAGRYRKDVGHNAGVISVTWTVNPAGYAYLRDFFHATGNGALTFDIDLVFELSTRTTHTARFVPGTFGLKSQDGQKFVVGADLEIST